MRASSIIAVTLILMTGIFCGAFLGIKLDSETLVLDFSAASIENQSAVVEDRLSSLEAKTASLLTAVEAISSSVKTMDQENKALANELADLTKKATSNKNLSDDAYESIIVDRLGEAVYTHNGTSSEIMIFKLNKADMRGYMAKITLKNTKALRVTINPSDKIKGETTSEAAERKEAIFAVNGGGFATGTVDGVSRLLPLGNAMIEGKLVNEFMPSWNDLAFAGFSKNNKLVGGVYYEEKDLIDSGAWQGVSFVPVLIKDWEPQDIPAKWAKARQPRTVLGQYPNGDIFFIVVDGRQSNWSNGITLEEMQILLLKLGVMEAFTLDGGGSSVMYYDGKILNKPSDGTERKLATNIVVMP